MNKATLVLDMDGVLVDFVGAAYKVHGREYSPADCNKYDFFENWGISATEFWEPINKLGADWWESIPEYPWADTLIAICSEHCSLVGAEFVIGTCPSQHADSAAGKLRAIQRMFGGGFRNYIITPRKWLICAGPRDILIDDDPLNCAKFRQRGGLAYTFPMPWNGLTDGEDGVYHVAKWLESIRRMGICESLNPEPREMTVTKSTIMRGSCALK